MRISKVDFCRALYIRFRIEQLCLTNFWINYTKWLVGSNEVLDQYKVGSRLGLSNSQTDDIVDDLNMGLIKIIRDSKILMTIDGKKKVEDAYWLFTNFPFSGTNCQSRA